MTVEADLIHRARGPVMIPGGRIHLARLFHEWGFILGAEIGVGNGRFSQMLCGENPDLRLLCVDRWYEADAQYQATAKALEGRQVKILRSWSVDATVDVGEKSLDFVYLASGNTLPHVLANLVAWEPKVRSGGVIAGYGYDTANDEQLGVVAAVKQYIEEHQIQPWFVFEDGKGRQHSFLWVKR